MRIRSATTPLVLVALGSIVAGGSDALARTKPLVPAVVRAQTPQPSVQIDVLVIEASNGSGGIATALQSIPQLSRPPFSAYTQLALVDRTTVPLSATPASVPFGSGDSVSVAAAGLRPTGRWDVAVQLTRGGRTHDIHFGASPNTPFFTAVTTGPNTAIILGFIVH